MTVFPQRKTLWIGSFYQMSTECFSFSLHFNAGKIPRHCKENWASNCLHLELPPSPPQPQILKTTIFFFSSCHPLHIFNGSCSRGNPWDVITSYEEADGWEITSDRCSESGTEPSPWPTRMDSIINHIQPKVPGNLIKRLLCSPLTDLLWLRWPETGDFPHRSLSLVENITCSPELFYFLLIQRF